MAERVAVTGAFGFIGRHLLRRLRDEGYDVIAVVAEQDMHKRSRESFDGIEVVSFADPSGIGEAVVQAKAGLVVHLSAYVTTERSLQALEETMRWNLLSTVSLLTACAKAGLERVILMGSCEEYGQNSSPFDARMTADPSSPYGASKAAATAYARLFHNTLGLNTVVLRPSVVYGPYQSSRMLIAQVLKALAAEQPVDVTEGRQTRDFIYVSDMADAIVRSLHSAQLDGRAWNVGSGEIVTVRTCLEMIEQITGRTGLIRYGGRAYSDREIFAYEPIVENTFETLGWRPRVTLEEGLRRTWEAMTGQAAATGERRT